VVDVLIFSLKDGWSNICRNCAHLSNIVIVHRNILCTITMLNKCIYTNSTLYVKVIGILSFKGAGETLPWKIALGSTIVSRLAVLRQFSRQSLTVS